MCECAFQECSEIMITPDHLTSTQFNVMKKVANCFTIASTSERNVYVHENDCHRFSIGYHRCC